MDMNFSLWYSDCLAMVKREDDKVAEEILNLLYEKASPISAITP